MTEDTIFDVASLTKVLARRPRQAALRTGPLSTERSGGKNICPSSRQWQEDITIRQLLRTTPPASRCFPGRSVGRQGGGIAARICFNAGNGFRESNFAIATSTSSSWARWWRRFQVSRSINTSSDTWCNRWGWSTCNISLLQLGAAVLHPHSTTMASCSVGLSTIRPLVAWAASQGMRTLLYGR